MIWKLIAIEFLIIPVEFLGLTLGERCDFYFQNEKAKENFNKRLILDFYQEGFTNPQNLAAAIDKYTVAKGYIQHNPGLAEGKEGFIAAIPRLFGNSTAPAVAFINNVVADGDFVWVHEKHILPSRTASLVNIFR